ncbi:DUF6683 family protein [Sphingomonas trueperi]|uniref:DUF6683 family protein n=1 Tax=Sphingomonas trueperi TaxID=53317 RepID=UPI000EB14D45
MQRRHAAIFLALPLVALPGAARAQMISPMLYEGPRIALESHANRFSSSKSEPRAPAQPAVNPAALRYTPSKARRSANLAAFVQKTRARDPRGADDLQKVFAEGDFIERIGGLVASQGLHVDDVADAYALWWLTAWHAARGNNDTPPQQMISAVQAQAARAVLATGEIAQASDAQKQELAEALWVQSALIDVAMEQAKQDPARLRQIGDAVRQGAKGMGLDLDAITLTSHGFVPAGAD